MYALLSLLLLAQLFTTAQERPGGTDSPPVEVLDAEVKAYEIRPRSLPDRRPDPPPGPVSSSDDIPGRGGSSRRDGKPSIAVRSSDSPDPRTRRLSGSSTARGGRCDAGRYSATC